MYHKNVWNNFFVEETIIFCNYCRLYFVLIYAILNNVNDQLFLHFCHIWKTKTINYTGKIYVLSNNVCIMIMLNSRIISSYNNRRWIHFYCTMNRTTTFSDLSKINHNKNTIFILNDVSHQVFCSIIWMFILTYLSAMEKRILTYFTWKVFRHVCQSALSE